MIWIRVRVRSVVFTYSGTSPFVAEPLHRFITWMVLNIVENDAALVQCFRLTKATSEL